MAKIQLDIKNKKKAMLVGGSALAVIVLLVGLFSVKGVRDGVFLTVKTSLADTLAMVGIGGDEKVAVSPADIGENPSSTPSIYEEESGGAVAEDVVQRKRDNLFVHIPNTAGDIIILKEGKEAAIINGGYNMDSGLVKRYLKRIGVNHVKYIAVTNTLKSSTEGASKIMSYTHANYILLSPSVVKAKNTSSLRSSMKKQKLVYTEVNQGGVYKLGKSSFELINVDNKGSLGVLVSNGVTRMLFTAGSPTVKSNLLSTLPHNFDVFSVAHTTRGFTVPNNILKDFNPKNVVMNDRKQIDATTAVQLVKKTDSKFYQSSKQGNVVIGSNGEDVFVNTDKK